MFIISGAEQSRGRTYNQQAAQRMTQSIDRMLRKVVVTLKEEQACLELWLKDKSVNEDVLRGIEISLTKISETLGKLAD